jgi:hypothetical protein
MSVIDAATETHLRTERPRSQQSNVEPCTDMRRRAKAGADGKCGDRRGAWSSVTCECCRDVRQMWQKKAAVKAHAARRAASDAMATWKAVSKAASDVRAMTRHTCDATMGGVVLLLLLLLLVGGVAEVGRDVKDGWKRTLVYYAAGAALG